MQHSWNPTIVRFRFFVATYAHLENKFLLSSDILEVHVCKYKPKYATYTSLHHSVQRSSGTHPVSYTVVTAAGGGGEGGAASFSCGDAVRRETDHLSARTYTYTPLYIFMAWCVNKRSEKFRFTIEIRVFSHQQ